MNSKYKKGIYDRFDRIESFLVGRDIDSALNGIQDIIAQKGSRSCIPQARLHALIPSICDQIKAGVNTSAVKLILNDIVAADKPLTLIESCNISTLFQRCVDVCDEKSYMDVITPFASVIMLCGVNIFSAIDSLRTVLFPFVKSHNALVQNATINAIACMYATQRPKDINERFAEKELHLLLSVVPTIVNYSERDTRLLNLKVSIECLYNVMSYSTFSVQRSVTSVLFLLRNTLLLGLSQDVNSPGHFSDISDTEMRFSNSTEIIVLSLKCIKFVAKYSPSLFSPSWSALVPSLSESVGMKYPFGGPTILTLIQFSKHAKVRQAASDTLCSMIDGSPVPIINLNSLSSRRVHSSAAFTSSSFRASAVFEALHVGVLQCLSDLPVDFATVNLLKVISCLTSRTPYASLPRLRQHVSAFLSRLITFMRSMSRFWLTMRHELFACIACVAGAPIEYDRHLIDELLEVLMDDCKSPIIRSPPNSFTVMSKIVRRHSPILTSRWLELRNLVKIALNSSIDHVRISALVFLEEWLDVSQNALHTFLALDGGEELLLEHSLLCWAAPSVSLRMRSMVILSHISHHSWNNELTSEARDRIWDVLLNTICGAEFTEFTSNVKTSVIRAVDAISLYNLEVFLLNDGLRNILLCCNPCEPQSLRIRSYRAFSNIINEALKPTCCSALRQLLLNQDHIRRCILDALCSSNLSILIDGVRSSIIANHFENFDHTRQIVRALLEKSPSVITNPKLQWNLCRSLGYFLGINESILVPAIIDVLLACCSSNNDKVKVSAITALNQPVLAAAYPQYSHILADLLSSTLTSTSAKISALMQESRSPHLDEGDSER
uniref:DUF4042 domain-containing protein n=1 Tax=Spongospora subterranea TaxID=70186 RepID=A0A0H5R8N3_9EUKA|eukprot:CRZ10077.1 hypothetical protein [Spongospora subterranea]